MSAASVCLERLEPRWALASDVKWGRNIPGMLLNLAELVSCEM